MEYLVENKRKQYQRIAIHLAGNPFAIAFGLETHI